MNKFSIYINSAKNIVKKIQNVPKGFISRFQQPCLTLFNFFVNFFCMSSPLKKDFTTEVVKGFAKPFIFILSQTKPFYEV